MSRNSSHQSPLERYATLIVGFQKVCKRCMKRAKEIHSIAQVMHAPIFQFFQKVTGSDYGKLVIITNGTFHHVDVTGHFHGNIIIDM